MRWMRRMKGAGVPLCLLGLGLGGCGEGQELRAFDGAKLKVFMPREPDGQGISLRLEVTDDGCPSISGTKAFVNGHELELVEPGGRKPGPQDPRYDTCSRPQFSSSKTPRELGLDQELSRFELIEGDERRVIEGRWLLARRELKWKNPGEAHSPAAGQVLVLEAVGPEGDVLMDDDHWAYASFSAKELGGPG